MASQLVPILTNEATAARRQVYFHLVDATDGITAETGEAGGQPQISTNGGAWTNTGIGTLSSIGNGEYFAEVTQSATNITAGGRIKTRYKSAATAEARGDTLMIMGADPFLALIASNVTQWLGSAPNALVSGRVDASVGAMAANVLTATAINADAITAAKVAADVSSEIADQVWDEVLSGHLTAGTTGAALNGATAPTAAVVADAVWDELRSGHVGAGSFGEFVLADAIAISGDAPAANALETMLDGTGGNVLTLAQLRINSTAAAGAIDIDNSVGPGIRIDSQDDGIGIQNQAGNGIDINSVNGHGAQFAGELSGIFAVSNNTGHGIEAHGGLTSGDGIHAIASTLGDGIEAVGAGGGFDINADIQGSLSGSVGSVTGNVGGNVVGSVGSVAAGGITAASFAAGAIDAAAIATDAIGSAELAASAVNEIADQVWDELLAGHAISGSTGEALTNAAAGGSPGAIADAVWDELRAGHVVAGSFGEGVASVQGNVTGSVASVTGNVGGNVVGSVASVTGNVGGNVTGFVGSVVGNVGGNVTGSVGSVAAGGIAAASFAAGAIDATAIAADAIGSSELASSAVDEIVDQVWDELLSGHAISGSTGEALTNAGSGASAGVIADAVWDELRAGHVAAGSFGEGVASVQGNVTGSVASVTGNVGGNVTGSVGSVAAGGITAASIATGAIDADALATDAVNEIVDQVWDETLAGHLAVGSTGEALSNAASGGSAPTVAQIADGVWDELRAGHVIAGSFGEGVASVQGNVTGSVASVAAGGITAASIATGAVDADALATDAVTEITAAVDAAITAAHGVGSYVDSGTPPSVGAIADAVWDEAIAGHLTAGSTGEALNNAGAGASPATIADAVWDEILAGHAIVGSTGEALTDAAAGGAGLTQQQVADALKLAPAAGAPAAGSVYDQLIDIESCACGGGSGSDVVDMEAL